MPKPTPNFLIEGPDPIRIEQLIVFFERLNELGHAHVDYRIGEAGRVYPLGHVTLFDPDVRVAVLGTEPDKHLAKCGLTPEQGVAAIRAFLNNDDVAALDAFYVWETVDDLDVEYVRFSLPAFAAALRLLHEPCEV